MSSNSGVTTTTNPPPPGQGKWNRAKRRLLQQQDPRKKKKITKEERREKYTAIAKERQLKKQQKDLICFRCRQKGHSIQYCTNAAAVNIEDNEVANTTSSEIVSDTKKRKSKSTNQATSALCCYKCGSTEHNLASCPLVDKKLKNGIDTDLPFATCFICQQKGHIASQCTQNQHGIYIKGNGQCKYCGSVYHRGSQCPDKSSSSNKKRNNKDDNNNGRLDDNFDTSDLIESSNNASDPKDHQPTNSTTDKKKKNRVVKF